MDKINEKYKPGLYFSVFSASLGGFSSGTILGWSSALSYPNLPLVASMAPLGALISALPSKKLADSIGRTPAMLFAMVLFLLSWIMLAFQHNDAVLIAGRLIAGMALGASWIVSRIYIMEISSYKFLVIFDVFVSSGLVFVNCLPLFFSGWQECHLLPGLVPLIFAVCFLNLPESPLYYLRNGKTSKVDKSLKFLGVKEIIKESNSSVKILQKSNLRSILTCFGLVFYQQLTNILGFYFYLGPIIAKTTTNVSPFISIIVIYLIKILTQLASIKFLEKSPRKLLLFISATFIALAHFCLGLFFQLLYCNVSFNFMEYVPVVLICIIFVAFSIGFGPVPDLISKDLFKTVNNDLYGFLNLFQWLISFLVTYFYPTTMDKFEEYEKFYAFGLIMTSAIVFVAFFL